MPLPFGIKSTIQFSNNQRLAYNRTKKIDQLKAKDPNILRLATEKMAQNISEYPSKFVPVPLWAQRAQPEKAYWILIMITPSKAKVRLVYDAAAKIGGCCLNDAFLPRPDRSNSLTAVLLRFWLRPVAFTADIKNMFRQFFVPEEDRTYMRFFWFKDNDPSKPLIEYWSCVQVQAKHRLSKVRFATCARLFRKKIGPIWGFSGLFTIWCS